METSVRKTNIPTVTLTTTAEFLTNFQSRVNSLDTQATHTEISFEHHALMISVNCVYLRNTRKADRCCEDALTKLTEVFSLLLVRFSVMVEESLTMPLNSFNSSNSSKSQLPQS